MKDGEHMLDRIYDLIVGLPPNVQNPIRNQISRCDHIESVVVWQLVATALKAKAPFQFFRRPAIEGVHFIASCIGRPCEEVGSAYHAWYHASDDQKRVFRKRVIDSIDDTGVREKKRRPHPRVGMIK